MAEKKISVILAEDHALVRKGLRSLLESTGEFEVVGEAANGFDAVKLSKIHKPDLVLLDLSMPGLGGLNAIKQIKQGSEQSKILIITMHATQDYLMPAFKEGADGYLLKGADPEELFMACKAVLAGRAYISTEVSGQLIQSYISGAPAIQSALDALTPREVEVLKLVAEGHTNNQVADILCISPKTVDKHRSNLMKKLNLHNIRQLTDFARQRGLIVD